MQIKDDPTLYEKQAKAFLKALVVAIRDMAEHPFHKTQNSDKFVHDLAWELANLIDGSRVNGLAPYFTFRSTAENESVTLITPENYLHELLPDVLEDLEI